MRTDAEVDADVRQRSVERAVRTLRPKGLTKDERAEWRRVGRVLAAPHIDRLKPHFVDVIYQYIVVCIELRELRLAMPAPGRRFYKNAESADAGARNGVQFRSHPNVAQFNAAWMRWANLVSRLGLSPADERNMLPGQGDLFDETDQYFR